MKIPTQSKKAVEYAWCQLAIRAGIDVEKTNATCAFDVFL